MCAGSAVERATVSPTREKCRPQPPHGSAPGLAREETLAAQIFWTQTLVNLLLSFGGDSEQMVSVLKTQEPTEIIAMG